MISVDDNDPMYKIKDGENALAFYSRYYQPIPLVLRGYGAGTQVTAAGVFSDVDAYFRLEIRSLIMTIKNKSVAVYAPASIGNVSVGFDVLGAAVSPIDGTLLGDRVLVNHRIPPFELKTAGSFVAKLPTDPN